MKKQLLIAAVAATMTSAAIADISITGLMKANYKNTDNNGTSANAISHEANIYVSGKNGDSKFYMEMEMDSGDSIETAGADIEDIWMSTKIADVNVKAGTWNGSDTLISKDSTRAEGKFEVSTTVSGVTVVADGTADANKNITLKGDVAGVAVSYKIDDEEDDEVKLSTTVNGITLAYHNHDNNEANKDKSSIVVSGSYNGVDLTYAQADADSSATIDGDSLFGDAAVFNVESDGSGMAAGDDIKGFIASTNIGGNKVKAVFAEVNNVTGDGDLDITKFVVTRSLAAGATLEVTYTEQDSATAATMKSS